MGPLEARGVAEGDRTSFWQAVIVDLFFGGTAWWDSSSMTFAIRATHEGQEQRLARPAGLDQHAALEQGVILAVTVAVIWI
jgi:hypothetical protein